MPQPPDPIEPSVIVEDPTDIDPHGRGGSFRDEKTAAAETRTVKLGAVPPWLQNARIDEREMRPRDPLFWPAVVFVGVLVVSIGFILLSQSSKHAGGRSSGTFSSP